MVNLSILWTASDTWGVNNVQESEQLLDGYMFVAIVMLNNGCICGMGLHSLYM